MTATNSSGSHKHDLPAAVSALIDSIPSKASLAGLDALADVVWALAARVEGLETAVFELPPVEPAPLPVDDLVDAIAATSNGGVLDCGGATFAAPAGGFELNRVITLRNAFVNSDVVSGSVTIATLRITASGAIVEEVRVRGGFVGIGIRADGVVVRACAVRDVVYAGVMTLSAHDCLIDASLVDGVRPIDGANSHNAYGITATNLAGQPISERVTIRGNNVRNVPTWHGIDTHGGADIHVLGNVLEACRRGIFLTNAPARVVCNGNRLTAPTAAEQAQTPPGGAPANYLTDIRGISVVGGSGEIRDNTGTGYPAGRWWNPITPGTYAFSGNSPEIP